MSEKSAVAGVSTQWPERLWVVRHGQSSGNVARDAAEAHGHALIDLEHRDADVPLSALGERQAHALGTWMSGLPQRERPTVVLCSPYVRARQTAVAVVRALGHGDDLLSIDERLREKEFGVLDRYTTAGILATFPELAEQRKLVGKFYFRPPGGELVRCDLPAARGGWRSAAKSCGRARVDRGASGDRQLFPLPGRTHGRGHDSGHRPRRGGTQLRCHRIRGRARRAGIATGADQLRLARACR